MDLLLNGILLYSGVLIASALHSSPHTASSPSNAPCQGTETVRKFPKLMFPERLQSCGTFCICLILCYTLFWTVFCFSSLWFFFYLHRYKKSTFCHKKHFSKIRNCIWKSANLFTTCHTCSPKLLHLMIC